MCDAGCSYPRNATDRQFGEALDSETQTLGLAFNLPALLLERATTSGLWMCSSAKAVEAIKGMRSGFSYPFRVGLALYWIGPYLPGRLLRQCSPRSNDMVTWNANMRHCLTESYQCSACEYWKRAHLQTLSGALVLARPHLAFAFAIRALYYYDANSPNITSLVQFTFFS